MSRKTIVGISTGIIVDKAGMFPGYKRIYVNKDYVDAVIEAGGIPMMIPFSEDEKLIEKQVEFIDALILTGGQDIFPYNYGEEPDQKLGECFPERDVYDYKLLEIAKNRRIPILGICRGMQIMNTFDGGTLYQDVSLIEGKVLKHWQGANPTQKTHKIRVEKDSLLSAVYPDEIMVNSFHHQAVKDVGKGYKVIAKASDGIIESISNDEYPFLVGTQWHPEMLNSVCNETKKLFKLFIEKATENK